MKILEGVRGRVTESVRTIFDKAAWGLVDRYQEKLAKRGIEPSSSADVKRRLRAGGVLCALRGYQRRFVVHRRLYPLEKDLRACGLSTRILPARLRRFCREVACGSLLLSDLVAAMVRMPSERGFDGFVRASGATPRVWVGERTPGPTDAPHPPGTPPKLKPA